MSSQGYIVKRRIGYQPLFAGKKPLLSHLDLELTERCNNACIHCYINLPERDQQAVRRELSTAAWKGILQQAADLGALSVRFTGGEPLLRSDFVELYLFARKLGMKVMLFTNARLITPEIADLFARVPPLKKIEVSVYGMHAHSYDAVSCSPGAFADFRRSVDLLLARQIPFILKSVILPPNRSEIDEFEAWAKTIPWMNRDPSYAVLLALRTRRDSPAKNRLISELRFTSEECIALFSRRKDVYEKEMAQFCSGFIAPQGDRLFSCGAGETVCVDAYGKLQMCMQLRHTATIYDLSQGTLRQALIEYFPQIRLMKATNPDYLERCARCFLKGLCNQCPAISWSEHGTLDTPVEYACQLAHAQACFLGLLSEGEYGWEAEDWEQKVKALAHKVQTV